MRDLRLLGGFPLSLTAAGELVFPQNVLIEESKVRPRAALADVALDPETCRGREEPAYFMYNGVVLAEDAARVAKGPIRYELTLMPPTALGRECAKTFGHLHSLEPRSGMPYAEICEVLAGTAHFLLQTLDPAGPGADVVLCVEVQAGERIVIPPAYDHLTINPVSEPLLFSDVIAHGVAGNYERFRATRSAAYLELAGVAGTRFIPNPTYRAVAPLRRLDLAGYPQGTAAGEGPLYRQFVESGGRGWPFLSDPRLFHATFPALAGAFRP